ncbi:MAG: carbamoyl-phosphate synthase large subunit [Bdellovibrionaceae bacterium]|nr:carbamoyl-phosphate synthase large subunit [Pseudobdellovibrionaceae bacterium]
MPLFKDLKKVVIFGSGPIVIGQACEFDYSGTQACKALMKEGLEVILINSNPATIMTDPEIATRVYIEPLKKMFVKKILEKERPDAVIPTLGGQTALNLALELYECGILEGLGIELLGAKPDVIQKAEDREKFCRVLDSVGAKYPNSKMVRTFEQGLEAADQLGFPLILRPNYTLGGGGGGVAYSLEEYKIKIASGLHESPTNEVLVEESILGWKEFELEVMRDSAGTFVVVCSIENFDPCGVHTGDSITVAPQQTLTDEQYQLMRDEAQKIINAVGVETGGANIQFAVNPENGERVVIEMNPRVSRSSALASKATGFPIAKIAALLAVGYTLEEIENDITKSTPACFEPALDYVVTKVPRFAFEKFSGVKDILTTQMKSVGEAMGIGRTFKESLQKALISLENSDIPFPIIEWKEENLTYPNSLRIRYIYQALRDGVSVSELYKKTKVTPWFLEQMNDLVTFEKEFTKSDFKKFPLLRAKKLGFSDATLATWFSKDEQEVREERWRQNVRPRYFQVDTCAAEFASETPYFYSTYWAKPKQFENQKSLVVLLGSGPNRIGQGIEFDYSCVRSVSQFQKEGYKVAMINSNPETVSTDYDTSDLLFFEPLNAESVLEVLKYVNPEGFVAQLGGQTPINLVPQLINNGYNLLGSSKESIDLAEDRGQFIKICKELNFKIPNSDMAFDVHHAKEIARKVDFPIICRPSYVLGGRRMEIIENEDELISYFDRHASFIDKQNPCLMDQFLDRALEVDVDLVRGKDWTIIGGVIEHIEKAGVHSGDSMGVLPPQRLKPETLKTIEDLSVQLADRMNIYGFLNLQLAVRDDEVFMLEANPRSSRSVPFIAKATGVPLVDLGVQGMLKRSKNQLIKYPLDWKQMPFVCVKGVVFPFKKFQEADSILGPEMKSTGESMGRGKSYSEALFKAYVSSQCSIPNEGEVFLSLRDKDKDELIEVAQELIEMGYSLSATQGTSTILKEKGLPCLTVRKVTEGRPHCVDRIRSGKVALVINTTSGKVSIDASFSIRRSCIEYSVPCLTEADAARSFVLAMKHHRSRDFDTYSL